MSRGDKKGHCGCSPFILIPLLIIILVIGGIGSCVGSRGDSDASSSSSVSAVTAETATPIPTIINTEAPISTATIEPTETETPAPTETAAPTQTETPSSFDVSSIPAYSGDPYVAVNNNSPYFIDSDLTTTSFESYGDLDSLGRCTAAYASIGQDLMPTEKRGDIGSVKPTGWHTVKYDGIDGNYLYNRCHLIGYQLTGENANTRNLITGTRYMNVERMEPFENMIADYIKENGNHVMYRVTPIFEGNNLLASGVLMEAKSVEDNGEGILFCVYCYNAQPGITIDYATGESSGPEFTGSDSNAGQTTTNTDTQQQGQVQQQATQVPQNSDTTSAAYIGNSNTMKFHKSSCSSVSQMSDTNKVSFSSRDEAISAGYQPCKRCNP